MRVLRAALAALLTCGAAAAQEAPPADFPVGQVQSVVLTIDTDRLFADSLFGRRIAAEYDAASAELMAENREIEAALTAEEQSLTDRRPTMEVEAFRAEAAAFDERVQGIRAAQDAKERALQDVTIQGRDAFLQAAAPILGEMMRAAGASVILDRRSVFLALGAVDITDEAIGAIDAAIGDGAATVPDGGPETDAGPPGEAAPGETPPP